MTKNTPILRAAILVALIVISTFLSACAAKKPILVGFSAQLTGRQADLGVASRNGAELAVEYVNENGGVNGRPIQLIVRDDKGDADTARKVDAELVEMGVVAVIGHPTSEMTAAVFDQMNNAQVVLLSSTSTSSSFTGKDDYFFRMVPSNQLVGSKLAGHIYAQGFRKIAGIYDVKNRSFSETFWQAVQDEFNRLGGDASQSFPFTAGETDQLALMANVKDANPEAIVFVAAGVDTALMAQYGRQAGIEAPYFSSSWGQTKELLEKGGRAVDGIELVAMYHANYPSTKYQEFIQKFTERYGVAPALGSSHSYEAVLILAQALKATRGERAGLPDALKNINAFEGLQGKISIDAYGDVLREVYVVNVENGSFVIGDTLLP